MKVNYLRSQKWAKDERERREAEAASPSVERVESPPVPSARTFADFGIEEARRICERRPHVIIREDPMFGRRGYAKEVLFDAESGYLVLVIAFTTRPDPLTRRWVEPMKPKGCERQFWKPGRVEIV